MLTTEEFRTQIKAWVKEGKMETVRQSATKRLQAKGYMDLGTGSFARWIEREWFEEGKKRGVISQDNYGNWIPVISAREEEQVTGQRGKFAITETKTKLDDSQFKRFMNEYKEYSEKKRGREYFDQKIEEENKQLIANFTG